MKFSILAASILLLLLGCSKNSENDAQAQASSNQASGDSADQKDAAYVNDKDQASYGIGWNFATNLKEVPFEFNQDALLQGISDSLSNKQQKITQETIDQAIAALQAELQQKQMQEQEQIAKIGKEFLAKNAEKKGVKVTSSGLQYEVIQSGKAKSPSPKNTDLVETHYHGTLIDGTVFDSSIERGSPAQFRVNHVIQGWTEALQLMKAGDKWRLYIPSELAYGANSPSSKIPAHSVLIFDLELLQVMAEETANTKSS